MGIEQVSTYHGPERRSSLKGIRALLVLNAIIGVMALLSFGGTVYFVLTRSQAEIAQRERAAEDSCFLLRGLVFAATPKGQISRAEAYINSTSLRNCTVYGETIGNRP